jgi:DDE superfamily endonuclease
VTQTLPQQYADLRAFRQNISLAISKRHDAVFNLIDALLERPKPRNIAELSLSPHCPRQWSSLYDAVEEAVFGQPSLEAQYAQYALNDWQGHGKQAARENGLACMTVAGDATVIRRSSCKTVDGLRYCHTQTHEVNGRGIVAGHQYQLLRYIAAPHSSWVMPLANDRLGTDDTQASLGAAQLTRFSAHLPSASVCVGVFDGAFGCAAFLEHTKHQRCGVVARMRHDRVLYRQPAVNPSKTRGAPKVYGERFNCAESTTWTQLTGFCRFSDERYGSVILERYGEVLMRPTANDNEHKHQRQAPITVDAMRCRTECGTERQREIWLVLQRNELPLDVWDDTQALWCAFGTRSGIEASIKVSKQECSWTMPQTFSAKAADTWTHLTEIAFWHLFLVRHETPMLHFKWQKSDAPITPRRARQGISAILCVVGSPASLPRPRGNSGGWQKGQPRNKRKRIAVIHKAHKAHKAAT